MFDASTKQIQHSLFQPLGFHLYKYYNNDFIRICISIKYFVRMMMLIDQMLPLLSMANASTNSVVIQVQQYECKNNNVIYIYIWKWYYVRWSLYENMMMRCIWLRHSLTIITMKLEVNCTLILTKLRLICYFDCLLDTSW